MLLVYLGLSEVLVGVSSRRSQHGPRTTARCCGLMLLWCGRDAVASGMAAALGHRRRTVRVIHSVGAVRVPGATGDVLCCAVVRVAVIWQVGVASGKISNFAWRAFRIRFGAPGNRITLCTELAGVRLGGIWLGALKKHMYVFTAGR